MTQSRKYNVTFKYIFYLILSKLYSPLLHFTTNGNRDRIFNSALQMPLSCHVHSSRARSPPRMHRGCQCGQPTLTCEHTVLTDIRLLGFYALYQPVFSDMPPKKPAPAAANKKTQEKKKEKIIEVSFAAFQHSSSMLNSGPHKPAHFSSSS